MARVLGALLSNLAIGKWGRVLVFKRGGNFQTVMIKTPQRESNTNLQFIVRKVYGLIQADYRIMTDELREEYREQSHGLKMSGHNVFYKQVFPWIYKSRCGESHCGFGTCIKA